MKDAASKTTGRFAPRPGADESRLRLVLETMQDAFVEIDGDGTITDWNRAAEVLFGWTRDEVLGRGLHDTIVAEQLREALGAAVDDFTSGGEEAITGRRLELPAVDRTGREFAAELSITPMRVGRAWRFAAFLRDASDRAPARQPLDVGHVTERVARLGSWHWVPLTGEMRFSEGLCRILGEDPRAYDPAQEMRLERVHPDDRERVRRTLDAACVAGDELETEFRVLRSDGEIRSLHVRGTLLRDAEGTHVRSMGTAQDVTERVRAEARNRRLAALVESTDDAVLSEEGKDDKARLTSDRVWIVDPLDGTREYGEVPRHDWAVHVALWTREAGDIVASAVALPALGTVLTTDDPRGGAHAPAAHEGRPRLAVSRSRATETVRVLAEELDLELVPLGSAGYKASAVVLGQVDAYVHTGGQYEWDSAAPVAVARAAGLHTSRVDGSPLVYNRPDPRLPDLVVCRPDLAQDILTVLKRLHPEEAP